MMMYLELAHTADIRMRRALPRSGPDVKATDISEGVVYDQGGVRVSAFEVDHGQVAKPAFGYRVDYQGRSVVLSGDTKPSANLIRYATGADVLIHEVMSFRDDSLANSQNLQRVMAIHTSPEQAGRVFAEAKPRLAVFTHIVGSAASPAELVARTRTTYSGPLEVGEDLMTIDVWDATARKAAPQEPSPPR
jgi:ribonuclease Z